MLDDPNREETMRPLLFTVSIVFLGAACAERPTAVEEDLAAPLFKKVVTSEDDILFTGSSTFDAYFPRTKEWFLLDVRCPAEATLTFGDGHDIALEVTELGDCGGRTYTMYGTMTPSGALKFNIPEFFVPLIMEHTGCTPSGTFPVYHGKFDGESLSAVTHFHGLCDGGTVWSIPGFSNNGVPFPDEPVPVHTTFGFELTVAP
jgi:hypothetical protein